MFQELPPKYNPKDIEEKWANFWAQTPLFHARARPDKLPFSIVIPPPNVTGILHMGHALNNTIQDVLIRWRRMQGYEALWMPGTDHAGIATQNVVERQIAKEGLKRQDLGREDFLKRVRQWKEQYGSTIIRQLKRMGVTCDWPRERFTMDEGYSAAVVEVFIRLYEKGLIYRGDYIINWCPRCQTALSDEEAPHQELEGQLYYIKYPLKEVSRLASKPVSRLKPTNRQTDKPANYIVVATTRPETMLGDTAVAVNPTDRRYKHLIGQTVIVPLVERGVKIIAEPVIDKKFGTGAVKVTPAHDPNDYQMGKTHNLDFINIMRPDGVLNTHAGKYSGMDRFKAREAIIEDLRQRDLLVKVEPHRHAVGHCYRCHSVVEPYLSKQWFVKMKPLSGPAIAAVKKGGIKFYPKRWTKVYLNWMENIKDWCISRQIWWGHRLPVYYCKNCLEIAGSKSQIPNPKSQINSKCQIPNIQKAGVIVSRTKPDKCPDCGATDIYQDEDVLDTWFSSWLWPFATFGWPFTTSRNVAMSQRRKPEEKSEKQAELDYFYPTAVLVTAPEIIFFWVARMIMAGCEFMGDVPFRDVYIHGTVRDVEGRKMSKSLGNSIDPLEIIDQYGADALRFSLITAATAGSDIYLSTERFEQGRNFANKIWNASRFIMMNLDGGVSGAEFDKNSLSVQDRWILGRLNETIKKVTRSLELFRFNDAANQSYEFFWHQFCDWYLEIAKLNIEGKNTQSVLLYVLKSSLSLLSPFMPFITEEILGRLAEPRPAAGGGADWPKELKGVEDKDSAAAMELLFSCVFCLRNFRAQLGLGQRLVHARISAPREKKILLEKVSSILQKLGGIEKLELVVETSAPRNCLSALIDKNVCLHLFLEGLVDIEKEKQRLDGQIQGKTAEIKRKEAMLANKDFVKKAPPEVVEAERQKFSALKEARKGLEEIRKAFIVQN